MIILPSEFLPRENEVRAKMNCLQTSEGRFWQCSICDYSHRKTSCVVNHIESIHFENVSCQYCGKSFTRSSSLRQHLKLVHPESLEIQWLSYILFLPLGFMMRESDVRSKMNSVQTPDGRVWQCCICNFSHKKTTNVINHIESIHFENVSCQFCGKDFTRTTYLTQHLKHCQLAC